MQLDKKRGRCCVIKLKIRKRVDDMDPKHPLITTAQTLSHYDLFTFTSRTLADLFELDKLQTPHLLHRMEQAGLVAHIEH